MQIELIELERDREVQHQELRERAEQNPWTKGPFRNKSINALAHDYASRGDIV